jgi:2-polyprenyl-3-methyl-5-hydroxy-6-metoxy-1,4-benzoquinol methylase
MIGRPAEPRNARNLERLRSACGFGTLLRLDTRGPTRHERSSRAHKSRFHVARLDRCSTGDAMASKDASFSVHEHDWHSRAYVDRWIDEDVTRDAERRPVLRKMLSFAPFAKRAAIRVLDVGAGYGVVTEEVLRAFPEAQVTWHDYSQPMREHAQQRLAKHATRYVMSDLAGPDWGKDVGGPFELVVSGIALHNLRDLKLIFRCYGTIRELLVPEGCFLDCDYFKYAGGVAMHMAAMEKAGFERVECVWQEGAAAIVKAA